MTPPVKPCEGGCGAMPGDRCKCVIGLDRDTGRPILDGRRLCACGCGERVPGGSSRQVNVDERHRQRAYERRLEDRAKALGRPVRLRQKDVNPADGTGERQDDAQNGARARQKRKPRQGVTVYLPSPRDLRLLDRWLDALIASDEDAELELARVREATIRALERNADRVPTYLEAEADVRTSA